MKLKPIEELTFTDDFLFGRVMQNAEICKGFLERMLEIKIEKIEYPELQKSISPHYQSKGIRLDVYVQDSNRVFDIEIQNSLDENLPKRTRYYQSMMDIDLLLKGKNYTELKESFIRYFWYSISGLFLLGMFFGCAMSGGDNETPQKLPQKAITRIITNRQIQRRLPICGTALLSEPCVFYVLNYSTTDHKPEDYYSYIANAMQRPPNSIKTENILYNKELIKPGYFAEIIVPVKR